MSFFINQSNNKSVKVGGVKLLNDFSSEEIVLRVTRGLVTITGEKLEIKSFSENEIEINGKIVQIVTDVSSRRGA